MSENKFASGTKRHGSFRNTALLVVTVFSALLVILLLSGLTKWVGNPSHRASGESGNVSLEQKYDMYITNQVSDALDGVLAVKKVYWIGNDELVAPEPNQDCYGMTDDPEELEAVLERAKTIMDGQEIYFDPHTELQPGTKARYYLDDTIFAITWKQGLDYGAYTFSEVKIAHPSQFRRFLASGEFGSEKLFITTEMAASVNAVVASSGDFYRFRTAGTLVYNGKVQRVNNGLVDTCYVDYDGNLHFTGVRDYMTIEEAQQYVDENNINFSLAFGPILIRNGVKCTPNSYSVGEIDEEYSRSALCQMGKLHYLLATVNVEGPFRYVPSIYRFTDNLLTTGCIDAYALDGGQTAVIAMNDELINAVMFGYQRKISDIIYFATAIPNT